MPIGQSRSCKAAPCCTRRQDHQRASYRSRTSHSRRTSSTCLRQTRKIISSKRITHLPYSDRYKFKFWSEDRILSQCLTNKEQASLGQVSSQRRQRHLNWRNRCRSIHQRLRIKDQNTRKAAHIRRKTRRFSQRTRLWTLHPWIQTHQAISWLIQASNNLTIRSRWNTRLMASWPTRYRQVSQSKRHINGRV